MERDQNININKSLKEADSSPHGWPWGIQGFSRNLTVDVAEIAQNLELEVEAEYVTEFP